MKFPAEKEGRTDLEAQGCKNCKHRQYEEYSQGYVCVDDKSPYFGDWVEDDWSCERFRPKNKRTAVGDYRGKK